MRLTRPSRAELQPMTTSNLVESAILLPMKPIKSKVGSFSVHAPASGCGNLSHSFIAAMHLLAINDWLPENRESRDAG
jgi:hypothetical protein